MSRNIIHALPPFLVPSIFSITSEQVAFPATNVLAYAFPDRPFRTTTINSDQKTVLDFLGTRNIGSLLVNRTNYEQIRLEKSTDGNTYLPCTPNLLLWSRVLRQSPNPGIPEFPWSNHGNPLITHITDGPDSSIQGQRIDFGGGDDVNQRIDLGSVANHTVTVSVWLRTFGISQPVIIRVVGTVAVDQTVSVGVEWQRFSVTASISGTDHFFVALSTNQACQIGFGGMQVSLDTTQALLYDYETKGLGLVIPVHSRTFRRHILLDMSGVIARFIRYTMPASQPTDDGQNAYQTGAFVFADTLKQLAGGFILPITVGVDTPQLVVEFESGSKEFLTLGKPRVSISFRGVVASKDGVEDFFQTLARLSPGQPFIFGENTWKAGGAIDTGDPSRAYLMRLKSPIQLSYQMPEIFEAGIDLEEIT